MIFECLSSAYVWQSNLQNTLRYQENKKKRALNFFFSPRGVDVAYSSFFLIFFFKLILGVDGELIYPQQRIIIFHNKKPKTIIQIYKKKNLTLKNFLNFHTKENKKRQVF
jgi:hypothetical protein